MATTTEIYNLIILDESGSMSCVHNQTISGCNETINTIIAAQQKFQENQKHYVSIYAFQGRGYKPSRYIVKNEPAERVKHITYKDYSPCGNTPLNDAVGMTLADLKVTCSNGNNAIGSVTIITDGEENASTEYTTNQVAQMIEQLKQLGWSFNFIGANIDVEATASSYNIDNALRFQQDDTGTRQMFAKERSSRMKYYTRVEEVNCCDSSPNTREEMLSYAAQGYFDDNQRVTPERIDTLKPNEIFVFGSNLDGNHNKGAAHVAVKKFGAIMGKGVGLQGQSYAIPTSQGKIRIFFYVDEFIEFAKTHPKLTFLVTRIGCGSAGFKDADIAPLFQDAINVKNIYLPQSFWDEL